MRMWGSYGENWLGICDSNAAESTCRGRVDRYTMTSVRTGKANRQFGIVHLFSIQRASLRSQHPSITSPIVWIKPRPGTIKLNVDVGFQLPTCTYVVIVQDHLGTFMEVVVDQALATTPLEVECYALMEAFRLIS